MPVTRILPAILTLVLATPALAVDPHQAPAAGLLLECSQTSDGWKCADRADLIAAAGGARIRAAWGDSDGSHLYLAGDGGMLVRLTRNGANMKAERVSINSRTPFQSDLTAIWGSPDGRHAWVGGAGGEILSVGSEGPAVRMSIGDSDVLTSPVGTHPPITGGWTGANGAMWVTAGNAAQLLRISGKSLTEVRAFVDADNNGDPATVVGVAGIDDGAGWQVAIVDDIGRMILADDKWNAALPPITKAAPGPPNYFPDWHTYRGIANVPNGDAAGASLWAAAWYGHVRRLLLTPGGLAEQCGATGHACILDPAHVAANNDSSGPIDPQLSLGNVNALGGSGPDNVWAVGDHGMVAHYSQSATPKWSRVEIPSGDDQNTNLLAIWAERGANRSVWLAGEHICPGRTTRPAHGVADVRDYWREGDADYTGAFQCAALALCPNDQLNVCGGVITVPTGVFPIHDTLHMDQEISLEGRGEQSIIEWRGTGRHDFGGNKVAIDIHGRPDGECKGACGKKALFPPPDGSVPLYGYHRGPVSLHHLTVRSQAAADSCEGDAVGRGTGVPDAVGIDIHYGTGASPHGGDHAMMEDVRVCGFKAGVRLGAVTQDNGFRGLRLLNNFVGFDLEGTLQNDLTDIDAERNGIGLLLNSSEVSFRGVRLADNVTGGLLSLNGIWWARGVRGTGNVRKVGGVVTGYDVAFVQGRAKTAGPDFNSLGAQRLDVKPLIHLAGPVMGYVSDMVLDGKDGTPGRILVVNPAEACPYKGGRVVIAQTGGATQPPLLDVLDECDMSVLIPDSNVVLRRLKDSGSHVVDTDLTTALFPGFKVLDPSNIPQGYPTDLSRDAPSIRFRDNGWLSVGTPLRLSAPYPSPASLLAPSVELIDRADTPYASSGTLRLSLPDANATITALTTDHGTDLVFSVGGKERARLNKYGWLGIGTDAPNAVLDVNGNARIDGVFIPGSLQLNNNSPFRCDGSTPGALFMGTGADGKPALMQCGKYGVAAPVQAP